MLLQCGADRCVQGKHPRVSDRAGHLGHLGIRRPASLHEPAVGRLHSACSYYW